MPEKNRAKKGLYCSIFLVTSFTIGVLYGILIHKSHLFPYRYIKNGYCYFTLAMGDKYGPWSIGIYKGDTPFNLLDPQSILNPVLTGKDVSDIDAKFVADPFLISAAGRYYMFFEAFNNESSQGDIGYAESTDGVKWEYKKIVIDENFHLSYPYVFEWNKNYYLVPESGHDFSVRLYKAVSFPDKWEYTTNLLSGYAYKDPTLFRYNDMWWMFVSTGENKILNLYYSDHLLSGWVPHPANPIVKMNKKISRPAGRVFIYKDKLYRLTQDGELSYGEQAFAIEIEEISKNSYREKINSPIPVVTKTGKGWNAAGMHHVDPLKIGNKWMSTVDGRKK